MLVSSVQSFSPISLNSASTPRDYTPEFQVAFENGDINQVCRLLDLAQDPYQEIELSEKVALTLAKEFVKLFPEPDREELLSYVMGDDSDEETCKAGHGLRAELMEKFFSVKNRLSQDPTLVSTEELMELLIMDYAVTEVIPPAFYRSSETFSKTSLMALALTMNHLELIHKLVEIGFDFSNPETLDALKGTSYKISFLDYGYTVSGEIPAYMNSKLYFQSYFSDSPQIADFTVQKAEQTFNLYDEKTSKEVAILVVKQAPLFGEIYDIEDLDKVLPETIDLLLSQGVAHEDIMQFDEPIYSRNEMTDFLVSRGFKLSIEDEARAD